MQSMGEEIYIDNNKVQAWVKNTKVDNRNTGKGYYEKILLTEHLFRRGSIIDYQDDRYIVLSDSREKKYDKYHKGNMRLTNELLYFKLDGVEYLFPSSIETEGMSFKTLGGTTMTLADGKMVINLQDNEITQKIDIEKRFMAMRVGWEVVGIDRSFEGLIKLHCSRSTPPNDLLEPHPDAMEYPPRNIEVEPEIPLEPEPDLESMTVTILFLDDEGLEIAEEKVIMIMETTIINADEIEGYKILGESTREVVYVSGGEITISMRYVEEDTFTLDDYILEIDGDTMIKVNDKSNTIKYTFTMTTLDGVDVAGKKTWGISKINGEPSKATISTSGVVKTGGVEDIIISITSDDDPRIVAKLEVEVYDPNAWGWG